MRKSNSILNYIKRRLISLKLKLFAEGTNHMFPFKNSFHLTIVKITLPASKFRYLYFISPIKFKFEEMRSR